MWSSTRWRAEPALPRARLATEVQVGVRVNVRACMLACALCLPGLASTPALATPATATNTAPTDASVSPRSAAGPLDASHPQLPGSRLQGEATLRFFGLRVYHARLWALPDLRTTALAQHPFVLELEYLRDLQGQAIAERSLQEMRRGAPFSDMQGQRWLADMQRIFPNVRAGDRLAGVYQPGQGVRFWLNGRLIGQVPDADFARQFFGIWLAPTTSEPAMRLALLGLQEAGR